MEILAPNWISIVELSFEGWCQLDRKIFQSAWIACGYMEWKDMPHGTQDPPITMEDARQVLDVFGKLGTGTPQWCTVYEWQIQDRLEIMIGLFWLFVCICTDGFFWFKFTKQTVPVNPTNNSAVTMLRGLLALQCHSKSTYLNLLDV